MSDPSNLEHLDEVLSAYVDGEATAAEVQLVESDASLMAQAQSLRDLGAAIGSGPPPNPERKRAHLEAAMGAFQSTPLVSPIPAEQTAPVVDLASRRRGPAGMPRWLTAVAASVVVVGGIGFVATQNSEDSLDTAADSGAATSEPMASPSRGADDAESADMEDDASSASMADDAMADDAMADEATESEGGLDQETASQESGESAESADESATGSVDSDEAAPLADLGFAPNVTIDELLAATEGVPGSLIEQSMCGGLLATEPSDGAARTLFDLGGDTAWYPVMIGDELSEFFVVSGPDGERAGVLFSLECMLRS